MAENAKDKQEVVNSVHRGHRLAANPLLSHQFYILVYCKKLNSLFPPPST